MVLQSMDDTFSQEVLVDITLLLSLTENSIFDL